MRNLTEEVNDLDEIENMDLEALQEYIDKDIDYKAVVKAIKEEVNVKGLHKDHPAMAWEGLWERLSLLKLNGPIVMDSEKILMPERQKVESAIALHGLTHGSGPRMISTLSKYMFWKDYKKDIQKGADMCEVCEAPVWWSGYISLSEGILVCFHT